MKRAAFLIALCACYEDFPPARDAGDGAIVVVEDATADPDAIVPEADAGFDEDALPSVKDADPEDAAPPPPPSTCIDDVPAKFTAIRTDVPVEEYLAASNTGVVPYPQYTDSADNNFGLDEHFQGVQRVGAQLIVSAGTKDTSQLMIVDLASRSGERRWSDPNTRSPAPGDEIVALIDLDPVFWHAGGIQEYEGLLAVPLERRDPASGEVRFYDLADVRRPRELTPRIARDRKLYVAALTRMPDRRFIIAVWDDETIELHRSLTADLEDGLDPVFDTIDPATVADFQGGGCALCTGTYQAMNFVPDCGGRIFLVATRNDQKLSPTVPGSNLASLYELTLSAGPPVLTLVDRKKLECHDRQCNFAAASGVFILDRDTLILYSAYHWLQDRGTRFNFNEY